MANRPNDTQGRPLRDLRISVTDRCNFRCPYCMPAEVFGRDFQFLPSSQILSFEEITRAARIFVGLGVEKVRVTGGEPLLRRDIEVLIEMLSGIEALEDLTLTTNGAILKDKAQALANAGLRRITVSVDSLDDEVFRAMNGVDFSVDRVLEGVEASLEAGLGPVKVNCVVKRGANESGLAQLADHFRGTGVIVRFIEYMDVGTTNGWRLDDVVSAAEILAALSATRELEPIEPSYRGEVAKRYRDSEGNEIGIIASVTDPFCGNCTRLRLSSEGNLYTCLFSSAGHDLRAMLRGGSDDAEIERWIEGVWVTRDDRYSEIRSSETQNSKRVEMSHIGG